MERRAFIGLFVGLMWCALDSFSQLAFAAVEINVAPLSDGSYGKVIGITNIQPGGTANAVVQARDKFGNLVNRTKTLTVNATKYGTWARSAMTRIPTVQVALGLAAAAAGYMVVKTEDEFNEVKYDIYKPGGEFPGFDIECPTTTSSVKNPNGTGNVQAYIPTPCYKTNISNRREYWATSPSTELEKWAGNPPDQVTRWQSTSVSIPPTQSPTFIYRRAISTSNPDVQPSSERVPVTDQELATWGFQSPDGMQEAPGRFPDIWNPVPWEDTASDDEIISPPEEPTDDSDYDPCSGDCEDASDLHNSVFDVTSYLKWGNGWLPRQCPAPVLIYEMQGAKGWFEFDYLCSVMTDFVAPFFRIAALFFFVGIVAGGFRE